jgi:hypothetical protein
MMGSVNVNKPGLHKIFDLFGSQLIDRNDTTISFPIIAIDHLPQRSTT